MTHLDQNKDTGELNTAVSVSDLQALTGTRYPTLPGFNFYYPYPTRKSFENFRVQGSNYTWCFHPELYLPLYWIQICK